MGQKPLEMPNMWHDSSDALGSIRMLQKQGGKTMISIKLWLKKETKGLSGWVIGGNIGYFIGALLSGRFYLIDWLSFFVLFIIGWYGAGAIWDIVAFYWKRHKIEQIKPIEVSK